MSSIRFSFQTVEQLQKSEDSQALWLSMIGQLHEGEKGRTLTAYEHLEYYSHASTFVKLCLDNAVILAKLVWWGPHKDHGNVLL